MPVSTHFGTGDGALTMPPFRDQLFRKGLCLASERISKALLDEPSDGERHLQLARLRALLGDRRGAGVHGLVAGVLLDDLAKGLGLASQYLESDVDLEWEALNPGSGALVSRWLQRAAAELLEKGRPLTEWLRVASAALLVDEKDCSLAEEVFVVEQALNGLDAALSTAGWKSTATYRATADPLLSSKAEDWSVPELLRAMLCRWANGGGFMPFESALNLRLSLRLGLAWSIRIAWDSLRELDIEPSLLDLAGRFHYRARPFVFAWLAADHSGRIAQLAQTCPGALSLASSFDRSGGPAALAARGAMHLAMSGRKLQAVLDGLSEALDIDAVMRRRETPIEGLDSPAAVRRRDAALIRAAPTWLQPDRVRWVRLAEGFETADIPREAGERAGWYALAAQFVELATPHDQGLPRYLSRNFRALRALARSRARSSRTGRSSRHWLGWIIRALDGWSSATGTRLEPRMHVGRLVERAERWANSTPIHHWIGPMPVEPNVALRPVKTAGALQEEGAAMRHCVARHLPELRRGSAAVFSGTLLGRRVTVMIDVSQPSPQLREARGFANTPLSDAELETLRAWVARLGGVI